jgi:hypothetical protein
MKYVITLRGERELWLEFVHKAKKEKKKIWEVLSPFLKKYLQAGEGNRVLLLSFPDTLVDQLLEEEDPEGLIEKAIRQLLPPEK